VTVIMTLMATPKRPARSGTMAMTDELKDARDDLLTALRLRPDTKNVRMDGVTIEIENRPVDGRAIGPTPRVVIIRMKRKTVEIPFEDGWVHEATDFIAGAQR
jgi:hypothetical protein